jgi:phenylacetate-coenzyme A ligase PaaK-like adenylate-forming protein
MLFVYGRSELTVPFFGAKVYPTDIEEIINSDPELVLTHQRQIKNTSARDDAFSTICVICEICG